VWWPLPDSQTQRFVVKVDDNFHYQDADERYEFGRFAKLDDAIATCKRIVLESLTHCYKPGMSADERYEHYVTFGEDPFVVDLAADSPDVPFSAWRFARSMAASVVLEAMR
jgi:hypothetical protein